MYGIGDDMKSREKLLIAKSLGYNVQQFEIKYLHRKDSYGESTAYELLGCSRLNYEDIFVLKDDDGNLVLTETLEWTEEYKDENKGTLYIL